jgi:Xaa-Pro dipeptidase
MATDRYIGINFARMREYRLKCAKETMAKAGVDLVITWDPYSIRYITAGYVTVPCRFISSQSVILPVNGDPHAYIATSFSRFALREEMPWMKDKVWNNLGSIRQAQTTAELFRYKEAISSMIKEHGLKNPKVALDGCCNQMLLIALLEEMGIKNVVNGTNLMFDARAIKNQDEIECLRLACESADAAFEDIRLAIRPGIRECDLLGLGMKRLYEMGADETEEFVVASGPRTNPLHIDFTDRAIAPGDLVVVDINGNSYNGYKSCYYRTFVCGKPTQEQKDAYKITKDMMYEGMAGIKAGATAADITKGWPKTPEFWGYDDWQNCRGFACGHGIGLSLHEAPNMFFPFSTATINPVLEENMVIAVETWYGKRGGKFGVRLEEDLVVTKDGYDLLTKYPVDELIPCWY